MRAQTTSTLKMALVLAAVVVVAIWLGRGVLLEWLKALHGVH